MVVVLTHIGISDQSEEPEVESGDNSLTHVFWFE